MPQKNKLEMCQYDTDSPAQGTSYERKKLKKGDNSHNTWWISP